MKTELKKRKKIISVGLLILVIALSIAAAQQFMFLFIQTDLMPSEYQWSSPWTVLALDFIEASLTITGSGYELQEHTYELTLTNIASGSNYILLSCDYQIAFEVGLENEILISGTHSNPALHVGETALYTGTFIPTLIGTGDIKVSLTSIDWSKGEPISWSTRIDNEPTSSKMVITGFNVVGSTKPYTTGTVSFWIEAKDGSANFVTFVVKVHYASNDTLLQSIASETDYDLEYPLAMPIFFSYDFSLTEGGALVMILDIVSYHG